METILICNLDKKLCDKEKYVYCKNITTTKCIFMLEVIKLEEKENESDKRTG
ncbi:MAG: hypothetical protein NC901_02845 [Candidatus Omnitrophica bacterium]|nr:hypothetical protein [Candidatus Omnitrophota bacterium]